MTQIKYSVIAIPCAEDGMGQAQCIGEVHIAWTSPGSIPARRQQNDTLRAAATDVAIEAGYRPFPEGQGGQSDIYDAEESKMYACETNGLPTVSVTVRPGPDGI